MEIVDSKYLTSEDQIQEYFEDMGRDFFDCGQGYFQTEAEAYAKVGEQYYVVHMSAEVEGEKQDRGDRLYFVESITDITYKKLTNERMLEIWNSDVLSEITHLGNNIKKLRTQLRTEL